MLLPDWPFLHTTLAWLSQGLWDLAWWQVVLYTLVTTHITIASVTIFLHRHQAHRALDLHAVPSHFFRFWLWLGTGMVTKEWVAVHRKHHARCETVGDPHSPQAHGLKTVFWTGAELYRAEAARGETLAKFSVKPYEFDIGWSYLRALERFGLATVKKVPPRLRLGGERPVADEKTLEALITNRYEVMAGYARGVRRACRDEIAALKARNADHSALQAARRWLHRDDDKVPATVRPQLAQARADHPVLDKMMTMREELRQLWLNTSHSREQLAADLAASCHRAEESGIAALREFSVRLRAAQV